MSRSRLEAQKIVAIGGGGTGFTKEEAEVLRCINVCQHGMDHVPKMAKHDKESVCNRLGCWFSRDALYDAVKCQLQITLKRAKILVYARFVELGNEGEAEGNAYKIQVYKDFIAGTSTLVPRLLCRAMSPPANLRVRRTHPPP